MQRVNHICYLPMCGGKTQTLQETSIPAIETLPKGFYDYQHKNQTRALIISDSDLNRKPFGCSKKDLVEQSNYLIFIVFFFAHLKGSRDPTSQQVNPIRGQAMLGGNFETLQEMSIPAIETLPKGFYQVQRKGPDSSVSLPRL